MARRALLVGIDDYPTAPLSGCVNDARKIGAALSKHEDGSPNFECREVLSGVDEVSRSSLRAAIQRLFEPEADAAVFFFAGHGTVNNLGGYLVTPDAEKYDEGIPMQDVLSLANQSAAGEALIILDCCHSGALGQLPAIDNMKALLRQGLSVLGACRETEYAVEKNGGGLFTSLVVDALRGGAADVCGKVTAASVYAYVDEILGAWDQRPLFKSHVSKLISLRNCQPVVPLEMLRLLPRYFPEPHHEFPLDPSYEPDAEPPNAEHEAIFGHLQKYRDARLLIPVGASHLYYAAINSKACCLTPLGKFYWHLANNGKI